MVEDFLAIGIFGQRYPRPIRTTNGKRPHVPWRIWNPLRADRDDLVAVEVEVHGLIRVRKVQDLKPACSTTKSCACNRTSFGVLIQRRMHLRLSLQRFEHNLTSSSLPPRTACQPATNDASVGDSDERCSSGSRPSARATSAAPSVAGSRSAPGSFAAGADTSFGPGTSALLPACVCLRKDIN